MDPPVFSNTTGVLVTGLNTLTEFSNLSPKLHRLIFSFCDVEVPSVRTKICKTWNNVTLQSYGIQPEEIEAITVALMQNSPFLNRPADYEENHVHSTTAEEHRRHHQLESLQIDGEFKSYRGCPAHNPDYL
ncbi:hypothetical protein BG003_001989 [Podila horticola]|nr:hypothetical protein BG003_001989 [Podila horticola]